MGQNSFFSKLMTPSTLLRRPSYFYQLEKEQANKKTMTGHLKFKLVIMWIPGLREAKMQSTMTKTLEVLGNKPQLTDFLTTWGQQATNMDTLSP